MRPTQGAPTGNIPTGANAPFNAPRPGLPAQGNLSVPVPAQAAGFSVGASSVDANQIKAKLRAEY